VVIYNPPNDDYNNEQQQANGGKRYFPTNAKADKCQEQHDLNDF
jgi:hypothetical protein